MKPDNTTELIDEIERINENLDLVNTQVNKLTLAVCLLFVLSFAALFAIIIQL